MILNELFNQKTNEEMPEQYQDVAADNTQPAIGELRKTKLTLKHINKLRNLSDIRRIEFQERKQLVQKQYGTAAAEV